MRSEYDKLMGYLPGDGGLLCGSAFPDILCFLHRYDKTIQETEAAYAKIMESSQTLLHVLKRESVNLTKKRQASS